MVHPWWWCLLVYGWRKQIIILEISVKQNMKVLFFYLAMLTIGEMLSWLWLRLLWWLLLLYNSHSNETKQKWSGQWHCKRDPPTKHQFTYRATVALNAGSNYQHSPNYYSIRCERFASMRHAQCQSDEAYVDHHRPPIATYFCWRWPGHWCCRSVTWPPYSTTSPDWSGPIRTYRSATYDSNGRNRCTCDRCCSAAIVVGRAHGNDWSRLQIINERKKHE